MPEVATDTMTSTDDLRQQLMSTPAPTEKEVATPEAIENGQDAPATPEGEKPGENDKPEAKIEEVAKPEGTSGEPVKVEGQDNQGKIIKIGSREFTSEADAITEAHRVVGRNANLADELRTANERAAQLEADHAEAKRLADEAIKANADWQAYYEGKSEKMPAPDADDLAEKVISKLSAADKARQEEARATTELAEIKAAPHWEDVEHVVTKLSDKVNPFTGKNFTPKEAYVAACQHLNKSPDLATPPKVEQKVEEKVEEEKSKVDKTAIKSAAARPSGGSPSAPVKTERKRDDIDDMLNEHSGMRW